MKLKRALRKYPFLKKLDLIDKVILNVANQLEQTLEGDSEILMTPLAKTCDPIVLLYEWNQIVNNNKSKINSTLLDLEHSNRSKFGARSIAVPWSERMAGLKKSFTNQNPNHIPKFCKLFGEAYLIPTSLEDAMDRMKLSSSASFPFMCKKRKVAPLMKEDFKEYLKRKDPCALYTRTTENRKTRNVWGYPFADTLNEMRWYSPILGYQKTKWYRAALISPDTVAVRITELILKAISSGRIIYSVDFADFDASVLYQYIMLSFEYFASCFLPLFQKALKPIGERICSIGIVTPSGIFNGKHGVPSGATFTNEIDSIVQLGIAKTNDFIKEDECQIQGDDGVYIMHKEDVSSFNSSFIYSGLKINDKGAIATDYALYCQNLYHIDYMKDGVIGGIYPTFRALNRILFMERFVDFNKAGIKGQDYFGIRCLTILENCKHHPLFEDLVRFVLTKEKFSLDISDDGLMKYCKTLNLNIDTAQNLNHQYGSNVMGIKKFEAYKLAHSILEELGELEDVIGV